MTTNRRLIAPIALVWLVVCASVVSVDASLSIEGSTSDVTVDKSPILPALEDVNDMGTLPSDSNNDLTTEREFIQAKLKEFNSDGPSSQTFESSMEITPDPHSRQMASFNFPTTAPTFMMANEMRTSLAGDNASYGNMFDIVALRRITIFSLDIHTDAYSTPDGKVYVEVWSKKGTFVGHHASRDGWSLLASCSVEAAGVGEYTKIPSRYFREVTIGELERRAFYVTLSSPDLRYSKVTRTQVGRVFESNNHLEFLVGVALGQSTFGGKIFDNRIWNGRFRYFVAERPRPMSTEVIYTFSIEHEDRVTNKEIIDSIDNFVTGSLNDIFNQGTAGLVKSNQLILEEVESSIYLKTKSNVMTCDLDEPGTTCTIVNSAVRVTHTNNIKIELVRHKLLMLAKNILNGLMYKNKYVGPEAVETDAVIELTGVEMINLSKDNRHVFEDTLKIFLNHTLSKVDPPVKITTVSAEARDIKINGRSSSHALRGQEGFFAAIGNDATATVELFTSITGEYQPPPEVKFDLVVTESLAQDAIDFVENLKKQDTFKKVQNFHVEPLSQGPVTPVVEKEKETEQVNTRPKTKKEEEASVAAQTTPSRPKGNKGDINTQRTSDDAQPQSKPKSTTNDPASVGAVSIEPSNDSNDSASERDSSSSDTDVPLLDMTVNEENVFTSTMAMIVYGIVGFLFIALFFGCCAKMRNPKKKGRPPAAPPSRRGDFKRAQSCRMPSKHGLSRSSSTTTF